MKIRWRLPTVSAARTARPGSVIPPELAAKLESLGAQLAYGPDRKLTDALAGLSALPAGSVVRASREIAFAANLSWWQPGTVASLLGFFRKRLSNKDLLRRNPDYAWLLIFHSDGHVREAALDAIEEPPTSPFFFAALAWRLNDWVFPVRKAAKRCARRVLHLSDTGTAVSGALYLLDRRLVWGRWSDEVDVLDDLFGRSDVIAALAVQFRERTTGPVATCLSHALRYPHIDAHLADLAANASQPAVRAVAYRCILTGKASWPAAYDWSWIDKVYGLRRRALRLDSRAVTIERPAAVLLRQAAQDRSAKVRVVAADALTELRAQLPDADRLIEQLARDRSYAVRWRADYLQRHPIDST